MRGELGDPVAAGRGALAAGDWTAAEGAFRAALADEESGRALEGVGEALWWRGRVNDCVEFRERAYAAYLREEKPWGAARCALSLVTVHLDSVGTAASASGWRRRARRLVDDHQLEGMRGWVLLSEAGATRPDDGLELAREALACARERRDSDLEVCALSRIGARLIQLGEVAEGLDHLDEAMAAALSSGGYRPGTTVMACCNALDAATTCAAFERVAQWVRAAGRFTERYACPFLHVECRALYGAALVATGDWATAERELLASIDAAVEAFSSPPLRAKALASLAELRLAQGAVDEAERLVAGLDGSPRIALAQARVHLASDRPAAAEAVLARWLTELGDTLDAHELVEAAGEAELAQGRHDAAAERGAALVSLVRHHCGSDLARARGERLQGRARLAMTDPDAARPHLEGALLAFEHLGMPFDTGRTRLLLAEALRSLAPEAAIVEAQAALVTFDGLGARPGADEAAALLRALGVRPSREPELADGTLTARETEVLELLGTGLSNPEIGERLYISRKTVEHHVGRVLTKLGVRNRAEAAAASARRRPMGRRAGRPGTRA